MFRSIAVPAGNIAWLLLAAAVLAIGGEHSRAEVIFSDDFAYANGVLAGNSGGTGWAGAWSGGTSQVTAGLPDTAGTSVRISSEASVTSRLLNATISTGGADTYFISFLFNAAPFSPPENGDYAGISLVGGGDSLFMGMPGSSGKLGFDWRNEGDGLFAAASSTTYLTLFELKPASTAGRTVVNMYATTDLLMSGSALAGGTALASLEGPNFSFSSVEIAGGYATPDSISVAGLAMATSADEAVNITQAVVPEPSGLLLAGLAVVIRGCGLYRARRQRGDIVPAS